jgi:hypothetical protein
LAVTAALPFRVNVQVFVLFPPLEQAPDQIASRSFVTRSVIDVPAVNDADLVVPTETLIPVGVDVTRSPLRPVAVTVNVALAGAGFTVTVAVRVTPAEAAVIVATVTTVTALVVTVNVAVVAPAATVTLPGTVVVGESSDSVTSAPPAGAPLDSVTVPCAVAPPVTLAGVTLTLCRLAGGGTGVTVSVAVRLVPA